MSSSYSRFLCHILEDHFGLGVRQAIEPLIQHGPLTLPNISRKTSVPVNYIKKSLRVLIQHNCVVFYPRDVSCEDAVYRVDADAVLSLLSYSIYSKIVEDAFDTDAKTVVEATLHAGQINASQLLFILGFKNIQGGTGKSRNEISSILEKYYTIFQKLVDRKYLQRCNRLISSSTSEVPVFESYPDETFLLPSINLNQICDDLLDPDSKVSEVEAKDNNILWRINVAQFNIEMKEELLVEAMESKTKEPLCGMIFKAILTLGRAANPESNLTAAVGVPEIRNFVNRQPHAKMLSLKYFDECLQILTSMNSISTILQKIGESNGGQFTVDIKEAFRILTVAMVEKMVEGRFGFTAGRIFKIIRRMGYVDQDGLIEKGMLSSKLARSILYKLAEANYVSMKEMRKTYTIASSVINKVVDFVFHVEFESVLGLLLEDAYQTMGNSRIRLIYEKEKYKRLLDKERKVEKILFNMKKTKCTVEQFKEVKETITIPEQKILTHAHEVINKLTTGQLHAYRTIFTANTYLVYNQQELY